MPDTAVEVILELSEGHLFNEGDGDRHRMFYTSLMLALSDLSVRVQPNRLPFGADKSPRVYKPNQLVISFHSIGPEGNILRFKESYISPYYTLDRLGYSGFSELAKTPSKFLESIEAIAPQEADSFVDRLAKSQAESNSSKYKQPSHTGRPQGRYVFLPLQTIDDTVAELNHLEPGEVAFALAELCDKLGQTLVIKRHPSCKAGAVTSLLSDLQRRFESVQISDGSIHGLIRGASCVVGGNSGVLFEALVQGAHVVSFAKSDYALATTHVNNIDSLLKACVRPSEVDPVFQRKFVTWYLTRYCVQADGVPEIRARISEVLVQLDIPTRQVNSEQQNLFERYASSEMQRRGDILFADGQST
ncbi:MULTISPECIES: hypothetical protein [unclassified Ruegeria]|uniref:hypothetical protein n=1 Tax=unclassified Ruegeria TaxID=2625375 RepID=UPI0014891D40|nr:MULTISPECIES: hypothetical protein [unclassified Ruegeria]